MTMLSHKLLQFCQQVQAKKSADGQARSQLLKIVMPAISGDRGKGLAAAVARGDEATFQKLWEGATADILSAIRGAEGGEATASAKKRTRK